MLKPSTIMAPLKKSKSEIFKQGALNLLSRGAASAVYINPDNEKQIIKEAVTNKHNSDGKYLARQQNGYYIIDQIRETGQDYGVNLPEFISNVKSIDIDSNETQFQSVTETTLPGIMLDNTMYYNLKDSTKNKLALQLAKFLTVIHGLNKPLPASIRNRKHDILIGFPKMTQENSGAFIQQFHNKILKQILTDAVAVLWQDIGPDEIIVTTHGDLRWPNIIYNPENEKIGVIDFENSGPSHIYRDFVSSPTSFNWDFVQRIIKQYNKIRKQNNNPIRIDADKTKKLLICAVTNKSIKHIINSEANRISAKTDETKLPEYREYLVTKLETNLIRALKDHGLMDAPVILSNQNQR